MKSIPVYYSPQMAVATRSFSPSAGKPRHVVEDWLAAGLPIDIIEPTPAIPVWNHSREYVEGVLEGRIENGFGNTAPAVTESLRWTNGAVISAARQAIDQRGAWAACAPASGFHHARWDRSHGYCTFNALVSAAMFGVTEYKRAAIIDCDYHYGDGTASILKDPRFSQGRRIKHWSAGEHYTRPSQAQEFLDKLPDVIRRFTSECPLVIYQAGADPHVEDPLGGFLSTEQLLQRDRIVFGELARAGRKVVWTLAGGYQAIPKLLEIHRNSMLACIEAFSDEALAAVKAADEAEDERRLAFSKPKAAMNADHFIARTAGLRLQAKTRRALFAILVEGHTWSAATQANGITRSGVSRALRRMQAGQPRCSACGQPLHQ